MLGLSLRQFAELQDWDLRTLRREAGGDRGVAPRTEQAVRFLEAEADQTLAHMNEATEDGIPVRIPHWSEKGARPGSWWHAIAGRLIRQWGDDAEVVYDSGEIPDDESAALKRRKAPRPTL
jgi:hypothetical protein